MSNMPTWIIYGIIAALFWGSYAVVSKVVTSENYLGVKPAQAVLLMLIGIAIVFIGYFVWQRQEGIPLTGKSIGLGILAGILWAAGMVTTFLALHGGADVARLTPLYNTNTLIAVFLGLLVLHEVPAPDERLKVIFGAILIVLGGILVSR